MDSEQARTALMMADDRTLTVHTYNEELAEAIYGRIIGYEPLMSRWVRAMQERVSREPRI